MTPQEKAKELLHDFSACCYNQETGLEILNPTLRGIAKQCALIAVDEIMRELHHEFETPYSEKRYDYWQQVKEEIEKL